jgi:hypothetical protein
VDREGIVDGYDGTRAFYERVGFLRLRELQPARWSDRALIFVMPL